MGWLDGPADGWDLLSPEQQAMLLDDEAPTAGPSLGVLAPVRRKWWEWLLRRPRRWRLYHMPSARGEGPGE
jgi:hypothetical protein